MPADRAGDATAHENRDSLPPTPRAIGGYRIIRKLGEGGMGVVYEAEQREPRRPVALKVIRGDAYVSEHQLRLFQREEQTLARLKHPHIAAIYEAGRTEEGQHFFVMELVSGVPLTQHIQATNPSLRARLELFCRITDAINYAHQRGVIHRDLKPSNVLVDQDGNPKILDFGLAKITDSDVAVTTVVTEIGKIQGTLPYMSPEQARGDPDKIDLRSDVYSLGVILYELLTGQLPYDVTRAMLHEAVRVICEESPRRPSTISRTLRGDVETIALKALEKEPERRYQSASALVEDVERYLASQPILARPPSAVYQFRKLVARHKVPFAFLTVLFVVITTVAVWMTVLYRESDRLRITAATEAERAGREAETAKQVSEFLVDLFEVSDPGKSRGNTITAREILDKGAEKIRSELEDQPEVQATLLDTIGRVYIGLGLYADATPLLESALAIRRRILGDESVEVAASLNNMAGSLWRDGKYTEAEPLFREALAIRSKLIGEESTEVAHTLNNLAMTLRDKGDYAGAEPLLRKALRIRRRLVGDADADVASMQSHLAGLLIKRGNLRAAEPLLRKALPILRQYLGNEHPRVADTLHNLGQVLSMMDAFDAAEPFLREALATRQRLYGGKHPDIAQSLYSLGYMLHARGDSAGAEPVFREALAMFRDLLGNEHPDYGRCLNALAAVLGGMGNFDAAEPLLREALVLRRKVHGEEHPEVAVTMANLGAALTVKGDYDEAEALIRGAADMQSKLVGKQNLHYVAILQELAKVLLAKGDPARAEPVLREAQAIERKVLPPGHWIAAYTGALLGGCLAESGHHAKAEPLLVASYTILEKTRGPGSTPTVEVLHLLIELYEAWGRPDRAAEYRAMLPQGKPSSPVAPAGTASDNRSGN